MRVLPLVIACAVAGCAVRGQATEARVKALAPESGLLLVPEGAEDGRLEVRELVGLQRAFLYAGTPAVITTLWKVDDRASFLLMRRFHERLPTLGPARALREAQRAATKEFPHPFAWAAFGLTGSPR